MVQSLVNKPDEEDITTGQITPITNIQREAALTRIDQEAFIKRSGKARISTLLCREIFQRKL